MSRASVSWWRTSPANVADAANGHGDRRLETGDVVSTLFPVHRPGGHEQEGYRPAVVVGLPERPGAPRFGGLLLVPMTSDRGQDRAEHSPALYPRYAAGMAGLRSPSICLLDQTRALGSERVSRYRGTLGEDQYRPIHDGLRRILGEGDK